MVQEGAQADCVAREDQPGPRRPVGEVSGMRHRHLHQGSRSRTCTSAASARTTSALTATERLKTLFDDERWEELAPNLTSNDPLKFTDTKPYKSRLAATQKATGQKDAVIVGVGQINGIDAVVASMEYSFIGGTMGVVVGEKIVRGIELALERRIADASSCRARAAPA